MTTPLAGEAGEKSILPVLFATLVGGAGTMTVELAAVRLLAPWYGTSLSVWTNVIAVVLLALALGYALGGRLSAGRAPLTRMAQALALAALWTVALPFLASHVGPLFVPEGLALDAAADVVLWGSLAASLLPTSSTASFSASRSCPAFLTTVPISLASALSSRLHSAIASSR